MHTHMNTPMHNYKCSCTHVYTNVRTFNDLLWSNAKLIIIVIVMSLDKDKV